MSMIQYVAFLQNNFNRRSNQPIDREKLVIAFTKLKFRNVKILNSNQDVGFEINGTIDNEILESKLESVLYKTFRKKIRVSVRKTKGMNSFINSDPFGKIDEDSRILKHLTILKTKYSELENIDFQVKNDGVVIVGIEAGIVCSIIHPPIQDNLKKLISTIEKIFGDNYFPRKWVAILETIEEANKKTGIELTNLPQEQKNTVKAPISQPPAKSNVQSEVNTLLEEIFSERRTSVIDLDSDEITSEKSDGNEDESSIIEEQSVGAISSTIHICLIVNEVERLIKFIVNAFDGVVVSKHDLTDGTIVLATLKVNNSTLVLGKSEKGFREGTIFMDVDNCDEVFKKAIVNGARPIMEPVNIYHFGKRQGIAEDPTGNHWYISTNLENLSKNEITKRIRKLFEPN